MHFEHTTVLKKLKDFRVCELTQYFEGSNHDPVLLIFDYFDIIILQALFQAVPKQQKSVI